MYIGRDLSIHLMSIVIKPVTRIFNPRSNVNTMSRSSGNPICCAVTSTKLQSVTPRLNYGCGLIWSESSLVWKCGFCLDQKLPWQRWKIQINISNEPFPIIVFNGIFICFPNGLTQLILSSTSILLLLTFVKNRLLSALSNEMFVLLVYFTWTCLW